MTPETAPAVPEIAAGNGATEGGLKSPPDAPASARSLVAAAGPDVALIGFLVLGEWCDRCGDQNYDGSTRVCHTCTYPDHPCSQAWWEMHPERAEALTSVARTLDVAERTVEKAREAS